MPILTCLGSTFASRVTASLLNAVGLPELVVNTLNEYELEALRLARNPTALTQIRKKLARNIKTYPLYDTELYCRHLEDAFVTMWERYQSGEPRKGFAVPAK